MAESMVKPFICTGKEGKLTFTDLLAACAVDINCDGKSNTLAVIRAASLYRLGLFIKNFTSWQICIIELYAKFGGKFFLYTNFTNTKKTLTRDGVNAWLNFVLFVI